MERHDPQGDESRDELYELEVIDGELVAHEQPVIEPAGDDRLPAWGPAPTVQTAVAAATGFVAGAATLGLLRRYGQSRLERAAASAGEPLPGSARVRTYIVHVRQLRQYAD